MSIKIRSVGEYILKYESGITEIYNNDLHMATYDHKTNTWPKAISKVPAYIMTEVKLHR